MKIKEIRVKNFKRFDDLIVRGTENAKLGHLGWSKWKWKIIVVGGLQYLA
ncbi:hypothetical protein [uncultured Helicobacter sp.]